MGVEYTGSLGNYLVEELSAFSIQLLAISSDVLVISRY